MLDEGHRRVLILEDDVLPQYDHLQRFDEVISQAPEDWELLMLGYCGTSRPLSVIELKQIYPRVSPPSHRKLAQGQSKLD